MTIRIKPAFAFAALPALFFAGTLQAQVCSTATTAGKYFVVCDGYLTPAPNAPLVPARLLATSCLGLRRPDQGHRHNQHRRTDRFAGSLRNGKSELRLYGHRHLHSIDQWPNRSPIEFHLRHFGLRQSRRRTLDRSGCSSLLRAPANLLQRRRFSAAARLRRRPQRRKDGLHSNANCDSELEGTILQSRPDNRQVVRLVHVRRHSRFFGGEGSTTPSPPYTYSPRFSTPLSAPCLRVQNPAPSHSNISPCYGISPITYKPSPPILH